VVAVVVVVRLAVPLSTAVQAALVLLLFVSLKEHELPAL
jgi:hypothetical protein